MSYPRFRTQWHPDDLAHDISLSADELQWIDRFYGSGRKANRIGFAILLRSLLFLGYFPERKSDVPLAVVEHLAGQLGLEACHGSAY